MTKNVKILLVGLAISIVILLSVIFFHDSEEVNDFMTDPEQTVELPNAEREDAIEELLVD